MSSLSAGNDDANDGDAAGSVRVCLWMSSCVTENILLTGPVMTHHSNRVTRRRLLRETRCVQRLMCDNVSPTLTTASR